MMVLLAKNRLLNYSTQRKERLSVTYNSIQQWKMEKFSFPDFPCC
jgi:hypothetical protein